MDAVTTTSATGAARFFAPMPLETQITALICVSVMAVAAIICFAIIVYKAVEKSNVSLFQQSMSDSSFLRLVTVIVIVQAALYLALLDRFSEGIGSLFSGITGYVLGSLVKTSPNGKTTSGGGNANVPYKVGDELVLKEDVTVGSVPTMKGTHVFVVTDDGGDSVNVSLKKDNTSPFKILRKSLEKA